MRAQLPSASAAKPNKYPRADIKSSGASTATRGFNPAACQPNTDISAYPDTDHLTSPYPDPIASARAVDSNADTKSDVDGHSDSDTGPASGKLSLADTRLLPILEAKCHLPVA